MTERYRGRPSPLTPWAACSNKKSMTALAFDTYKAVKALREAGADEALAEAVVATVGDAIGGNVVTHTLTNVGDTRYSQISIELKE